MIEALEVKSDPASVAPPLNIISGVWWHSSTMAT